MPAAQIARLFWEDHKKRFETIPSFLTGSRCVCVLGGGRRGQEKVESEGRNGGGWVGGSLIPRPSSYSVFDCLQYAKMEGEGLEFFYHMICGTDDITGSGHSEIFTLVSSTAEKLEKQVSSRETSPTCRA